MFHCLTVELRKKRNLGNPFSFSGKPNTRNQDCIKREKKKKYLQQCLFNAFYLFYNIWKHGFVSNGWASPFLVSFYFHFTFLLAIKNSSFKQIERN